MTILIDDERLGLYSRLLSVCLGCKAEFGLHNYDLDADSCFRNLFEHQWQELGNDIALLALTEDKLYFRTKLTPSFDELSYWLVLSIENAESVLEAGVRDKVLDYIKDMAELFCLDLCHTKTLTGMAHELAVRYEELNILYGMDWMKHEANCYGENAELECIKSLSESCLDYLSLDFVSIIIPSEKLDLLQSFNGAKQDEEDYLKRYLKEYLYEKIVRRKETWVVNHHKVTDWVEDLDALPYKLIVSPIMSVNDTAVGIFVLGNSMDKPDFTNSDRKLCNILTTEISSILLNKYDKLTGLLNRSSFEAGLRKAIIERSESGIDINLIQLNINQFRIINENIGHVGGDEILCQVADVLRAQFDSNAVLARTGGDEFSLLLINSVLKEIKDEMQELMQELDNIRYFHGDNVLGLNLSIGLMHVDETMDDPSEIMNSLEITCQSAKDMGSERIRVFNPTDEDVVQHNAMVRGANMVKEALLNDSLVLYAQEIRPSLTANPDKKHFEILVRINNEGKHIAPGLFIPAAEKYNIMSKIDEWVLKNSLQQLSTSHIKNKKNIALSINISGQSVADKHFITYVEDLFKEYDIDTKQVCLEITETAAVQNLSQALKFIDRMRELGCSFALDDFGSGMSSFYYLKNMPVDYLKIDGCFVKNMLEEKVDFSMVESINNIGHVLGLKTVAEFVENVEIEKTLVNLGIDYLQGYHVHRPEVFQDILDKPANLALPKIVNA